MVSCFCACPANLTTSESLDRLSGNFYEQCYFELSIFIIAFSYQCQNKAIMWTSEVGTILDGSVLYGHEILCGDNAS
jgi:hypothetical protein